MVYIKRALKKIWGWLRLPYDKYQEHKAFKQRMKELKKQDPFIYK